MGLKASFFGIESLYDPSAKAIGKGLGRDKTLDTLQRVKASWGNTSRLHGGFIIGLPHETRETADEWTTMLIDGHTALDTMSCNALHLVPNNIIKSGDTTRTFFSEFDLNKEKYGYKETSDEGWVNKYWTKKEANLYANDVLKRFVDHRPYFTWTKSAQKSMACMNLKIINPELTWKDVHKSISNDDEVNEFESMINGCGDIILDMYKEKMLS
jgi:radical SAM superfamily enzyme YgiQ (UPF0313 family)